MMHSPKQAALLLIAGFLVTLTSAVTTCPPSNITDVSACTNISPVDFVQEPCTPTIQQYACSSVSTLAALPDDFLVTLSSCYSSVTVLGLDPIYSALYFSKMDNSKINTVLSKLKIQFTSLAPEWRTFLLKGIWSVITQNLNGSADQLQWIPTDVQPFLAFVTPDMVQCAQKKNVTCATFQELVKRLDAASPNMPITKRQNLYPALKSFLMSRQNLTGSACPVSGNSSAWLQQNFGNFSQFADYNDFVALNGNFSAMEALSSLTVPQIVSCSLFPATGPGAAGNISDSIVGTLKNSTDVYNFLTSLNNAVTSKNNGSVTPQLSQALLNKTFQVIRTNFSSFNSSDWAQLFQNQLSSVLPEITTDQLSLIPNNISCNSYQAIVKGLDSNFSQMTPAKQESVYKSFVKPYLTNKGSACPVSGNSSAWLQQNFGNFSQFADYNDFVALNGNFSAMEALSSLTVPQIVSCSLFPATGPGAAGNISDSIVGTLKNSTDVYNFLTSLNNAVTSKNNGSVTPQLSQALLNKTFQVIRTNFSSFNSSDWAQLFQNQLSSVLPEITTDQLSLIPNNISCNSYQAIVKGLDSNFSQMTPAKQESVYKSFVKPYLTNKGSACPVSGNSSAWLQQNFGNFSQFADYNDFVALNGNFSAMEALSSLTVPQIVSCSLFPATGPGAAGNISDSIVGTLKNSTDVYNFLTSLNNAVTSKNNGSVTPQLSQALLNKTFQVIRTNFSSFNSSDWAQLFQNQLSSVLPEITTDQLSLIPNNISCNSYQAIVKGLDSNFSQMTPAKQESVYKSFVKPYLTNKGSACPVSGNSSAWLQQNFGNFSQFADYNDFVALNGNFSAMEALSSLTVPQIVSCSLFPATGPGAAGNISDSIVGTLKNSTDVYNFLTSLNNAVTSKNNGSVTPQLSQALLNKTFQVIRTNFSSFNSSDWAQLFQNQLSSVLPEITTDQMSLIPNNISCNSYQAIVKGLDSNFSQMTPAKQESVYKSFVKPYLTNKGNTITCFNQTDANSSAWLVTNMASFMTYTSEEDLALFANETMLQIFASDSSCVQLASQLKFPKNTAVYYTSLLTSSGNTNLSSVPVTFFCYLKPSALKKLNANEALAVSKKINQQCFNASSGQAASNPTSEEVQVATSLVSKLNNFSSDTIINLGQSAVGLSPSQINSISNKDLESSLSSLSNINGWTKGQSRAIMNKLLQSNFQIKNLENLGSLVSGLPSKKLQDLDPQILLNATKNAQFVNNLSSAPPALQDAFVKQITAINSTPSYIVKNVPGNLVSFIPKSLLNFNSEKPVLQDVNSKSWSADQASMFFDDVVSSTSSYSQLSASVLQGFTCGTPSKINKDQMKNLAKAMKTQNALLSEDQVNCLTRQITKDGYPTDLDTYPKEVFLFLNASNYSAGSCKDFFTNVGMANVSILPKDSKRRADLLAQSLSCMNVTGYSLTDDNIQVLGQLACDLNSSYINNSTGNLLTQLSQCKSFTADQQDSIQKAITSGNSVFGAPSTWTKSKLNSIGGISGILNKDILTKIPSVSLKTWMQESIQNSALTRNQFASIVTNISPTRSRRASSCPSDMQITADNVNNDLLPMEYNAVDLDACLDNQTLINYLEVLGNKPFTNEQLNVLKNRLDQLYPGGYPESVIPNLGAIIFMCGPNDINKWNITSVDTLGSLLAVGPTDAMAALYIGKFTSLGNPLNGSALNIIGSNYICLLTSAQLALITPSAISEAKPLDISACNQTVKDSMYAKAKLSYQGVANQTAYYSLIKPYLGGAPVADLKSLAAKNPNMDIGTFIKLNPSSVMGLSVSDVKGLLGSNTVDLVNQQSNPVVSAWIKAQKQSDLDTLGLGLQGGIRDYVYTTLSSSIATAQQPSSSAPALPRGFSIFLAAIVGILLL